MADTLESLEIEVKHSASGAADEITKVADAISGLSRALNRSLISKLADLASAMKELGGAGSPINLNNYTGNTFNKTVQSVRQAAASTPDGEATPLSDELQETIANAGKLEVALHKASDAAEKMNDAFEKGNVDSAWRQRERALNAAAQVQREIEKATPKQEPVITPLSDELQDAISSANQIDLLRMKLESLQAALQDAFNNGDQGKALTLRNQILQTESALAKAEKAARGAADGVRELGKESKKAHKPLSMIVKSMARIAFYRVIRSILKDVGQAFQEGLKNAYAFSQGISTEGNRFAAALDSMSSSGLKMKNQLGSAFIGLLAAIAPIVNAIISLVVRLANALSQLFAAFTGRTYLKANDVSAQFADNMKKGAGAAKEWKNQLLGFDEINRLNEPSGGGGGGAAGIDPSTMFSDTPLDNWAMKIHDNLALIETAASGFALALGLILTLSGANIPLGLGLIALGAVGLASALKEDWGTVDANIAKAVAGIMLTIGGALLAVGALLVFTTANIPLGLGLMAAGAASMATGALINWKAVPNSIGNTLQAILLVAGGALLALGLLITFATPSFSPLGLGLIIAGAASLAAGVAVNWDFITQKMKGTLGVITTIAGGFLLAIGLVLALSGVNFPLGFALMAAGGVALGVGIKNVDWDAVKKKLQGAWQGIKDWWNRDVAKYFTLDYWQQKINSISPDFGAIFSGLIGWCQAAHAWIQDVIDGLFALGRAKASNWQNNLTQEDYLTGFASGGFPSEGQLFMARESGPELVGTVGSRTAVANNDQIVEGIRQGVYDAVLAANANNGGGGEFRLYLDSKQIKYGLERVDRAWGV